MSSATRLLLLFSLLITSCTNSKNVEIESEKKDKAAPFVWENATAYFLLTDRFNNGDISNDLSFNRKDDAAPLRGFLGGDIRGVIQKLDAGYFDDLGVNVLWMTPVFEQVKSHVDEGHGTNYGFHGYWMRDWTTLDPNFGRMDDLAELVKKSHERGIRIMFDVVVNHTGPVTDIDSQWPDSWVRTEPTCTYKNYETTISCTLVKNLPDIRTESDQEVELPQFLLEKWEAEGRLDQELASLDDFFSETGYPRAARFYIMKWIADYVRELGIDAFRVDTARHAEESVWLELLDIAQKAFDDWKDGNPAEVLDENQFFMLGEVYGYSIFGGRKSDFGDGEKSVDYYNNGFNSLINFSFKDDMLLNPIQLFEKYDTVLNIGEFSNITTMNYISSHDDGTIHDRDRTNVTDAVTKLLLSQGISQLYYGDETGRKLTDSLATGDATLRTFMNWEELETNQALQSHLQHCQIVGKFRAQHPAIGAGRHSSIQAPSVATPFVFSRTLNKANLTDQVIVVMGKSENEIIPVGSIIKDGSTLFDAYAKQTYIVNEGIITSKSKNDLMLLEVIN
jgi:alpha-amylase